MANFVFNIALGKVITLISNVVNNTPSTASLVCIPIETDGLQGDAILRTYDTFAALLGGGNKESAAGRKPVDASGDITQWSTPDDANNRVIAKVADQTWAAIPASVPQVACFLWCYSPVDPVPANNSQIIPLTKQDRLWKPDGTPFTLSGPNGFYQANAV
jgi:hypothetical protein